MSTAIALTFRIFHSNQIVREVKLAQSVIKIGKVPTAHVRLEDESVSRMHAIIEVAGDQATIIDLGSTRGTFVNGQKINKATLRDGDSIVIGESRMELSMFAVVAVAAPAVESAPILRAAPPALPAAVRVATPAFTPAAKPAVAPASTATVFSTTDEEVGGARAIEVATMLGDSVVDVKHCMDPRGGKVTRATWAFLAGGVAALIVSGISIATSVDIAAENEAKQAALRKAGAPERAYRPTPVGTGTSVLAFGGLALGLLGMSASLLRARSERRSPYYRIGTAPGVEQPLEGAPSESFPLVAPHGDDFVFNFGAGMEGELTVDGVSTPLADLAGQGRARPSTTTAGAIEVPIPAKARIRARAGQTTFLVSAVAKPKGQTLPVFANLDRRVGGYVAGSLAAHLGLWLFLQTVPPDEYGVSIDVHAEEMLSMHASNTMTETAPPDVPESTTDGDDSGDQGAGGKMALPEGAAGNPNATRESGHIRIKNNNLDPQLAKAEAIRLAREAGVLGSTQMLNESIASITGTGDMSSGFDLTNVHGPIYGAEGEGRGNFGGGRTGFGLGGGCLGGDCGVIGDGRYGTIGNGREAGLGYEPGRGRGGLRRRVAATPPVVPGMPSPVGNLDKEIIRRYIKRSLHKIAYCYESELLARPDLNGEVMAQFLIAGDGSVQASHAKGFDTKISGCVAQVIKSIGFPKPTDGGSVQVNYPFNFRAPIK
ncbi:MAG TPA: AgmX/PglI C-terminal domain-containing protein [Kofleriaceae bacterium]